MEVKLSLSHGFKIPHVVTAAGQILEWAAFSCRPDLWHSKCTEPPAMKPKPDLVSMDELKCMRVLARIQEGLVSEIASLADLDEAVATNAIATLRKKKLLLPVSDQEDSSPLDTLYWKLSRKGLSYTMRRWNAPPKIDFTNRREGDPGDIRIPHRHASRMWPE